MKFKTTAVLLMLYLAFLSAGDDHSVERSPERADPEPPLNIQAVGGDQIITVSWEHPPLPEDRSDLTIWVMDMTDTYIDIGFATEAAIYGIQFNMVFLDGYQPVYGDVTEGVAFDYFTVLVNSETGLYLAYSLDSTPIPAGSYGLLMRAQISGMDEEEHCVNLDITNIAGYAGQALSWTVGEDFCGTAVYPFLVYNLYREGSILESLIYGTSYIDSIFADNETHCYQLSTLYEDAESELSDEVCATTLPPSGCMDPLALNYDPEAEVDDGNCEYIWGCTDPLALNFDPEAVMDDGTCEYVEGCTNPLAINYNPQAVVPDGSCIFATGCMDPLALNYNPGAVEEDFSCIYEWSLFPPTGITAQPGPHEITLTWNPPMSNSQRSTASLRIETLTDFYADLFLNVSEPVRMLVFYLYSDEELNAGWLDAYGAEGEIRDFQFVTDGHGNYAAYSRSGTSLPAGEYILTRINWSHDGDNAGFAGVQLVNVVAESGLDLVLEQSSQVWYDPANQNQHTYKIKRDNELIQENWIGYQFTDQGCSFPQVCCYRIATVAGGLTSIYSAEICESPYLLTGCTDPGAQNYNPLADQDDLSCLYDFEISEPAQLFNINPHPEAEMGTSVSNDGDYAIAGAPGAEDNSSLAGSAFTYRKITSGSDSYWITEGELIPSYSHINDDFGQAVAVSGSLALVSAPAFDPGGMSASGVVYAFERINGSWQETAQISGSNTDFSDYFGSAIDLDNQTAVIGGYNIDIPEINSGGVYFFELINETWIETAFFTCPTPDQEDQFGYSVSVDGDVAVVSARRDLEGSNEFGSAFVYTRVSGEWVFRQRLEPVSNTAGRIFGESVAVQDSLILVGAANNGIDPSAKGKGILFAFEDGQWEETAVFTAPDGQVQDDFARSVAFENNLIAIGAPFNFDAPESLSGNGSVYLYGFNDGSWRSLSRISAFNGSIMDRFGSSVSISGTTILAGAPGWDNPASNSGSAYVTEFEWNEFHYGCTDQLALNYNPEANLDDGSCLYFDVNFNLVPQQFPTIQEAITYSINGDTILVAPGEYMESINFLGKSLYITSHYFFTLSDESISQTIINGHYDEPVVTFDNGENNSSVLSGFTVEHGGHRVFDYDENGFTENYGGGVFCLHSSPRLEKLVLRANLTSSGSKKGGGITCLDSHPIISDVIIEDNQGYMGSGIYMLDSSPVITNCIMRKNTGGIYCGNSHPVINGIDFIDNEDDKGSALYSDDHSHPIIQNAVFRDNRSWDHGGAVYLDHAALTLRYADIYENSARYGGAFYLIDSSHVHLSQVDIHDNSADYATGGINAYNSFVYLDTVQVRSNDGANYGGGISLTNSELTLNAVSLTNNRAISGGGIYLKWDWAIHTEGEGAIAIYNNQAEWGRDFYQDYYSFDTLTMEIDTFSVDQANAYHAWPDGRYELSIGHGQLQTIDQDLFVSPNGDDANEGTSWSSPLATISAAMERIRPPADSVLTVFLDSGTIPIYREDDTYSLICDPGVSIAGFHRDSTIVIGEDSQRLTYKYSYGTELRDFTLSGPAGPGMTIYGSEMDVHDLAVRNISSGTGITFDHTSANLWNSNISGNLNGAGLYLYFSDVHITNSEIRNNTNPSNGGGIYSRYSHTQLDAVKITGNTAASGGGIYLDDDDDTMVFSTENRSSIYNNSANLARDIFSDAVLSVVVDTFTVLLPTQNYASPLENFTFSINNHILDQIQGEIYISADGDNNNDGATSETPFASISHALGMLVATADQPAILHLAPGTYSVTQTGEDFPLYIPPWTTLMGDSPELCILDGQDFYEILFLQYSSHVILENLTITQGRGDPDYSNTHAGGMTIWDSQDVVIRNSQILGNTSTDVGAGISCKNSGVNLSNILFENNVTNFQSSFLSGGAGFYANQDCDAIIDSSVFRSNSGLKGAGAMIYRSDVWITNSLFDSNQGPNYNNNNGGGLALMYSSYASLDNVNFTNNQVDDNGGAVYLYNRSVLEGENVSFTGNTAESGGCIFHEFTSRSEFKNSAFVDNYASLGGGVFAEDSSSIVLDRCLVAANSGGGGYVTRATAVLNNVTMTENNATYYYIADGLTLNSPIKSLVLNSVLSDNDYRDLIVGQSGSYPVQVVIGYSAIGGNYSGDGVSFINWLPGVITSDPGVIHEGEYIYHLQPGSPGIDGGLDYYFVNYPEHFVFENDYQGRGLDMGYYEHSDAYSRAVVNGFGISATYPNPFNDEISIEYKILVDTEIKLEIFDIQGRLVKTIKDGKIKAGYYQYIWAPAPLSSGCYFVSILHHDFRQTEKILFLK